MEAPANPLGEGITGPLARTRPWMKFVAIMGFIAAGFALMGALPMLTFSQFIPLPRESAFVSHGLFILMGLLYVVVAVLYFVPSFLLFRYATSLDGIERDGGMERLARALEFQRRFWKYVGISLIVGVALGLLSTFGMFVFVAVTAASMH